MGGKMSKRGQFTPSPVNQRTEDRVSAGGKNKETNPTNNRPNSEDPINLPVIGDVTESPENVQYEMNLQLTNFTTSLLHLAGKDAGASENMLLSPFSVAVVLIMAYIGAKDITAYQIKNALQLAKFSDEKIYEIVGSLVRSLKSDGNFILESVNTVYVEQSYGITDHFQSKLKEYFDAPGQNVDFANGFEETRVAINKSVEEFTRSKIRDLLPSGSLNSLTRLVLVNALYFKGDWLNKFDSELTVVKPFYLGSEENKMDVHMMLHNYQIFRVGDLDQLDARVIELPYKGRRLSMMIILPNKINGLSDLESKLSSDNSDAEVLLDQIDDMLIKKKLPEVAVPKFKIEADVPMQKLLEEMGITDFFSDNHADLSGISGSDDGLYCSKFFHKCFIEVNEEGSEAAAASAAVIKVRSAPEPIEEDKSFVVDHPALFFIRDNETKLVIFVGRLVKPSPA